MLHRVIIKNKAEKMTSCRTSPLQPVFSVYITLTSQDQQNHTFMVLSGNDAAGKSAGKSAGNFFDTKAMQIFVEV